MCTFILTILQVVYSEIVIYDMTYFLFISANIPFCKSICILMNLFVSTSKVGKMITNSETERSSSTGKLTTVLTKGMTDRSGMTLSNIDESNNRRQYLWYQRDYYKRNYGPGITKRRPIFRHLVTANTFKINSKIQNATKKMIEIKQQNQMILEYINLTPNISNMLYVFQIVFKLFNGLNRKLWTNYYFNGSKSYSIKTMLPVSPNGTCSTFLY